LLTLAPFTSLCSADVKEFLKNHRYDEAISELEDQLKGKDHSDNPDLLFNLGKAYHKKGLIYSSFYEVGKEVEKDYYEFLKRFEIKTYLPFYLGICYFEIARYHKAIDEFNDFKNIKGLDKTYRLLSSIWIEASRFQLGQVGAMRNLEEIRRKNENNSVVVTEVAYFLSYLQEKNREALQIIQGIKPPKDLFQTRFYRNLAYIYMKNDMFEKVKEMYGLIELKKEEFTAEINPELKILFYDLTAVKILAFINYYLSDRVLSQIKRDQTTHQRWQELLYYRGKDAFDLTDYHGAVELLGQSEHPVAKVYLGSAYYKLGQQPKAKSLWNEVEKSKQHWALRELGQQYASLKVDQTKAIKLCQRALELIKERRPEAKIRYFRYLGWTYLQNGEPDKAVKAFEEGYDHSRANDLDYYEPEFLNERAFCLYKKSELNWTEAIEIYFLLQERYPPAKQIHYAMQGIELAVSRRKTGPVKH
ncbi:MAG: tetratricopeptide repeat protein, partial [Candidatus Zixiibacteriota bacterium]